MFLLLLLPHQITIYYTIASAVFYYYYFIIYYYIIIIVVRLFFLFFTQLPRNNFQSFSFRRLAWHCWVHPNVNFPPGSATTDSRSVHISNGSVVYLPISISPTVPMKIKVKKIHAVGVWSWVKSGGEDERCAVCQNPLDGCAPGSSFPGDDSPVVWGKCNHAFHLQCINRWLGQIILVLYAGASGSFKKQIMASKTRTPLLNNGLFDGTKLLIYREMCFSFTNCTLIQDFRQRKQLNLYTQVKKLVLYKCIVRLYDILSLIEGLCAY